MRYKLIIFDMDGVLFEPVNFWLELHKEFGTYEKGVKLTKKYLHSDYNRLVEEIVVKLWKGKDAKQYYKLVNSVKYMKGIKKLFAYVHQKDFITAIITSGSIDMARRVQKDFGVEHIFANELVIRNGKVSGKFVWPIGAGTHKKAEIIRSLCKEIGIKKNECIYIGDSETDLEAFKEVGLAIAFNSDSAKMKKAADYSVDSNDLSGVLKRLPK